MSKKTKERAVKTKEKAVKRSIKKESLAPVGKGVSKNLGQLVFEKTGKRDLADVFGEKTDLYQYKSIEEYEEYLNDLNLTDLESHAIELSVRPRGERDILTRNLLRLYRSENIDLNGSPVGKTSSSLVLTKEMEKLLKS